MVINFVISLYFTLQITVIAIKVLSMRKSVIFLLPCVNFNTGTYGVRVANCFAFDKKNVTIQLIDERG